MKTQTELVDVIHNPNEKFEGFERNLLVDKLTEIARDGFGTEITYEDVENHVLPVKMLYIMQKGRDIIGFSSYDTLKVHGKNILYLHGIVIKKTFQGQGLFQKVNKLALSTDDFDFLAMRTQNPVIYAAAEKVVEELYPNKQETPEDVKAVAEAVARDFLKMEQFDRETFIRRKTYGQCLYDKVPRHERSNDFFDNMLNLNYDAGDSVLLVGRLK